jgi:hypothetical protein
MHIVFTLCSANYLAHAKTLGDSVMEHNPDCRFVIGLVDRLPSELESTYWRPYELIPVEELNIRGFDAMADDYNVVEFNTAVKPFYIEHLYRSDLAVESVTYLDPDIIVYSSFARLLGNLKKYSIVLTPHICSFDNSDINLHAEIQILLMGVYNLGFIATSRTETTFDFLDWWQKRIRHCCHYRPGSGVFVDQLWVNLAPVYFPDVYVEKDPGYNMCYWNHFERRLSRRDGRYLVNDRHELVFFHFSAYNPEKSGIIASRGKLRVMSFSERPDLRAIYDDYRDRLFSNGYRSVRGLPYTLRRKPKMYRVPLKERIKAPLRRVLEVMPSSIQKRVRLRRSARSLPL